MLSQHLCKRKYILLAPLLAFLIIPIVLACAIPVQSNTPPTSPPPTSAPTEMDLLCDEVLEVVAKELRSEVKKGTRALATALYYSDRHGQVKALMEMCLRERRG